MQMHMNCTYLQANRAASIELRESLEIKENERNQEENMDFFQINRATGFTAVCNCLSNLLYYKIYLNRIPE